MTDLNITEAGTVQSSMVSHAARIGWTPLSPQEALRKRGGETEMLFRAELAAKLKAFNPWMIDRAIGSVIEKIDALPPTIDGNSEILAWLRGERQWYDEDEKRHRRVRLIDFDAPDANVFHVTWEWKIKPLARNKGNRADVVFVVNGVPVAIVENKNPTDTHAVDHGVTQLQRYEMETPELMGTAQLFNVTNLLEYWYGVTWNISRRFMARWKKTPEETYRSAVRSFFKPRDFLRTLRDWILFYVEDGEMRKSVLRQHQRRAIDRIVKRCAEPTKNRGLIWHTQGSGKTFTLLTAARLILERKKPPRPTVIVVVDRTDLEGQLQGWVKRLIGEMQQQAIVVERADSKAHLQELLQNDRRGLILSMIHKFEGLTKNANERDNIYVFIDEAHRSVAQNLGTYLMAALPKATIIGFTGTPIDETAHGRGTFKIFGKEDEQGYLDKYTIAESIEDETTLPIRYTMAPSDMRVPTEQLDKEFFELAQAEGVTDIDELNKALDRAVGLRTFLTADDRIEKVAAFVAKHFRENIKPLGYKAFLVGVNREACAKYKRALDKLLPPEWTESIYTPNANDIVERPLVAKLQLDEEREANARMLFKKADENPKLLIVTDKLLTGYDAPLLYCMYLDKPMRNHVLLQAIARVNRPYAANGARKRIGLIVDFVGVLREMEKALQFDSKDVSGVIEDLDLLLGDLLDKIEKAKEDYLSDEGGLDADERLEKIIYGRFRTSDSRKALFETYKEIEALWEILSPSPELRDHIETYKKLADLYVAVRNAYSNKVSYIAELANKTRDMVQDRAEQEGLGYQTKTVTFDEETINALQNKSGADEAKVIDLVRGLQQEIADKPEQSPILLPLGERAKRIQQEMEAGQLSALEAVDQLSLLAKEKDAAIKEARASGLSWRAYSVHQALKDEETLKAAGVSTLNLAQEAERLLNQFPNAASNDEERRELRSDLYSPLLQMGMATEECRQIVDRILTILLGANADHEA